MSGFPLYDILVQRARENQGDIDLRTISSTIKSISDSQSAADCEIHYSNIMALMLHHYYLNDSKGGRPPTSIYGINITPGSSTKGVVSDARKLPPELQAILDQYIKYSSQPS